MDSAAEIGWEPHEIALLGGGPPAAVTVAVVALHLLGAVETGPRRTLCATGPDPEGLGPFEGTVLDCLREPLTARELVRHTDVRLALALARIPLAEDGLLGPCRRPGTGRRTATRCSRSPCTVTPPCTCSCRASRCGPGRRTPASRSKECASFWAGAGGAGSAGGGAAYEAPVTGDRGPDDGEHAGGGGSTGGGGGSD
ncbi:TIGR04222 domain-containing membrane protein [Streptomyces olivaceus]|uniref:TIGR04222 domain-containing membrane protein n=1 Tax=Streptomyces olivaceus TaxID=47716 RepID=UPI00339ED36A